VSAGLVAVIPETPVSRFVICAGWPPSSPIRYTFEMPCRSEMKNRLRPSGAHCGLMFFPSSNPPAGRMSPVATSRIASRGCPAFRRSMLLLKRSVLKAIARPSGDHDGCSSENASLVTRRSVLAPRS